MITVIQKPTSRGQITIPKEWMSKFDTNNYALEIEEMRITITPIDIKDIIQISKIDTDKSKTKKLEKEEFRFLTQEITKKVIAKYKNKKIPSIEKQLAHI